MNLTSDKAKEVVGRPKLVLVVASFRAVCFREEEKERNTVGRFLVTWIGRGESCTPSQMTQTQPLPDVDDAGGRSTDLNADA